MGSTTNTVSKNNLGEEKDEMAKKMSSKKCILGGQYVLRALCFCLCLSALIVMLNSDQTYLKRNRVHQARYTNSSALKLLVIVNIVVCGCSAVSLLYVFILSCYIKSHSNFDFMLFLYDLAVSMLMTAGSAAGTAVGYVGMYGQSKSNWLPICYEATKFCNKITLSVLLFNIGLICYLLLTFLAVLKIKSCSQGT